MGPNFPLRGRRGALRARACYAPTKHRPRYQYRWSDPTSETQCGAIRVNDGRDYAREVRHAEPERKEVEPVVQHRPLEGRRSWSGGGGGACQKERGLGACSRSRAQHGTAHLRDRVRAKLLGAAASEAAGDEKCTKPGPCLAHHQEGVLDLSYDYSYPRAKTRAGCLPPVFAQERQPRMTPPQSR